MHPLSHSWQLWMNRPPFKECYDNTLVLITGIPISTIENFWRTYNNIHKPSQFFYRPTHTIYCGDQTIEGYSFFKDDILPSWEDPRNAEGHTLTFRSNFSLQELDDIWRQLLLLLIGGTIPFAEQINGVRIIDRGSYSRGANSRFEIWTAKDSPIEDIQKQLCQLLFQEKKDISAFTNKNVRKDAVRPKKKK